MAPRSLGHALVLGLALAGPAAAQQLLTLPDGTWARDITPDGEVVVGTDGLGDAFIWRWRVDAQPTYVQGGQLVAVSDDGSVAAGTMTDPVTGLGIAALWTAASGWQPLGTLPGAGTTCSTTLSTAYDISGDGSTVVGLAWTAGCFARGFRWTAPTGMQALEDLANGTNRASAISGDGSAIGGFAQGSFDRTPAYWSAGGSGAVIDQDVRGEVYGFSADGDTSVGTMIFDGTAMGDAFMRDAATGEIRNLGRLNANWTGHARDLSADRGRVVGFDTNGLGRQAWLWTEADGIVSMNDLLNAQGVAGAPDLLASLAISADGAVIVGGAKSGGPFGIAAFIAELEDPSQQWTDLGHGLAGSVGVPRLVGSGPLTGGSTTRVSLTDGEPDSPGAFVIGLQAGYAPFKQGVLVPLPDLVAIVPALSNRGSVELQFAWPAGVPGGVSTYWQALISDAGAVAGYALSNAVEATTP